MNRLDDLRRLLNVIRPASPAQAAALEHAIAEIEAGQRDLATVNVGISYKLEKFEGEYQPEMVPVEVIEGADQA